MIFSARRTRLAVVFLFVFVLSGSGLIAGEKLWLRFQPLAQMPQQISQAGDKRTSVPSGETPEQADALSADRHIDSVVENSFLVEKLKRKRGKLAEHRYDKPGEAMEFFRLKRLAEGDTELPVEKYLAAYRQMELMPQHTFGNDNLLPSRKQMGKNAVLPGWTSLGPGNIGGRTRALVIHPTVPTTMYAAGVAGGVWKTTNGGANWSPLSDLIANLAVNSLAMDAANPNTLYAGTGEGFFNNNAVRGAGIFKTTDGGATWMQLSNTTSTDFHYVNDLIVSQNNSNRIYAATRTGIWRSTDGGTNWTKVLNATEVGSTTVAINGGCLDLAIRTDRATDYVFASCGNLTQSKIFRNTDAGAAGAWIQVHTENNAGRTSLAIAPSNQDIIYAMSAELSGTFEDALHAVFRSTSSGDAGSWTARVRNTDPNKLNASILSFVLSAFATNCGLDTANTFGGQAWYDNVIAVDPTDPNRVWAGGIDLFRSDDGGANWGMAAHAYQSRANPQYVHPDQHVIVFHPQYNGTTNQTVYIGNDGGIYRSDNARAATATGNDAPCNPSATAVNWTSLNNGYGVTQFYHGSVYPNGATYFGGTKDNGTVRGSDSAGANAWSEINGGDGGYSAVDPTNTNILFSATTDISVQKSINGGTSFSPATTGINDTGLFITPYVMDPSNPQRLFLGGRLYVWRTSNGASSWQQASAITPGSGSVSAIAVSPTNANFALAGMSDGFLIRTDQALTSGATTTWPSVQPRSGYVSSVVFDPTNKDIAYATYSTFGGVHVWKTVNAGASWTGLNGSGAGTLPDVPVHSIVVDPTNTMRLYIGTDVGVFATTDGGTTWAVENTGFANVITEWLTINSSNGATQLFAFTHGRGAWRVTANPTGCNFTLTPSAQTFDSTGGSGNIAVTAEPNGCNWTAVSNAAWITINSGVSGTSSGTVAFSVAAYTGTTPRTGTITAAGKTFTVTQTGCATIASSFQYFEAAGGMGSIPVTATGGCTWTVTGNPNWVTINSGAAGTGNGAVNFTVAANASASARQTALTVAGQSFTILQGGANGSCAVMPIAMNQAISGTIAASDCGSLRNPTSPTDRYSFTGTAGQRIAIRADSSVFDTLLFLIDPTGAVVAANDDGDYRTSARIPGGTSLFTLPSSGAYQIEILSSVSSGIGAYTLSLSSGSANCGYAVSPVELNLAAAGGNSSFNVTATGSGCDWAAATDADWIAITSGATGSGDGTVSFTVAANSGFARSGGIVVAGQLVTINQAGTGAVAAGRWATQNSGTTNQLNQVFFLDDNQGWLVGANSTSRSTSNGGSAWNGFTVGGVLQNYHSVRFLDLNNGWVGGDRTTAITANGGGSWPRLEFATGTRNRLFPINTTNAVGVGELNGGGFHANTLIVLSLGFGSESPALSTLSNLRDLYYANPSGGWSVGDKGQIFRLTKAGNTFDEQTGATTQTLWGVFALDLCTAWAVGDGGVILKTINAGQSWTPQNSGVTTTLRDVHFLNADRGWAVGDGGVILVTWDGGATWTPEASGTTADLRGVHTNTINAVYAVGANGTVVKRTLCSYTLSATMASFAESGGSGSVNVTTTAGCAWTATSNANWITINSGATGNGNGTVNFTVAANTGLARTGTITVAGQTFTVNQAVACPTVMGFTPVRGAAGSSVVITGTNLTEVTAVRFANNVAAQFTVNSATQLTATVPAGAATGPITISKTGCGDVQTSNFIFCNPITINPATLNSGTLGVMYNQTLSANGGTADYSFSVTAGALPNGLTLSSSGVLSGVPAALGTASFTVTATDASGCAGARAYSLQILPSGYEADVFPRPNGDVNGQVTMSDWTQLGRFVAGLDSVAAGSEFQRADCAPRDTFGNGQLTAADWVQAGRYAAGLDPIVPVGGPAAPVSLMADNEPLGLVAASASLVRAEMVIDPSFAAAGKDQQVIKLLAQGGENALSFSLLFESSKWKFTVAELTDDAAGANLLVNREQEAEGKLGFLLAFPTGKSLPPGEIRLFTVTFSPLENAAAALFVSFGDAPLAREISDVNANRLPSNFVADYSLMGATACASVSAASFAAQPLAAEQIVAAFGADLAPATLAAQSLPLPTSLGEATVIITDSRGVEHLAGLFFVSPTQINYLLPAELATGVARVTISASGKTSIGLIDVAPIAPSFFTANADGRGVAAAVLLRVRGDGSQNYESVARFDAAENRSVAVPIVFGEPDERLFLLLYGTGLRNHKGAIQSVIGGVEADVLFAGEATGFVGLDQVNVGLPRNLAGRGEISIQVNFGDRAANAVTVVIQ